MQNTYRVAFKGHLLLFFFLSFKCSCAWNLESVPFRELCKPVAIADAPAESSTKWNVRRSIFKDMIAALFVSQAQAVSATVLPSSLHIQQFPPLEYLEPLYEVLLSVEALSSIVLRDPTQWSTIEQRLDRLQQGGQFSESNYYVGLADQYLRNFVVSGTESDIQAFRQERLQEFRLAMIQIEELQRALKTRKPESIKAKAQSTASAFQVWWEFIPDVDRKAVASFFRETRQADVNNDGRLDDEELQALSAPNRDLWKRRNDVMFGT